MTGRPSERLLVDEARRGNREAFDELAERYKGRVLAHIRARLGPLARAAEQADDIYQETLTRAFQYVQKFRSRCGGAFHAWLRTIAEHVICDAAGRKDRGILQLERDPPANDVSPSRVVRRQERFERLERAFKGLSPDHQKVLYLARIEGRKVKEIAAMMDRSPGAVQKLLARALLQLRHSFGDTESIHLPDQRLSLTEESDER